MAMTGFKARLHTMRRAFIPATVMAWMGSASGALAQTLGRPTDKGLGLQPSGDGMRDTVAFFHNVILLPIITAISLFVLGLLVWVVIRYNKRSNPTPAKFSHNTPIEIVWTVVPVLILTVIAAFSFPLLYKYHDTPKADLTIKATGNQWYWAYEYPDLKVPEYVSNMLPEAQAGSLYKLAVDKPIVVPVGKTVKVLVGGNDVLHAFFIPAFGIQSTAIPGKTNEVWFQTRQTGKYYGQCNELCGANHAFMPIEVDVVTQPEFDAWVAAHAAKPAATTAATPAPTTAPAAPASAPTKA